MKFRHFVSAMLPFVALQAPLVARAKVGGFGTWAAFCDEPSKCFAISQPSERSGDPFLTIALVGRAPMIQVHLGRAVRAASLSIGDAEFALRPAGEGAVADSGASRRIVAAMRGGETLIVSGTSLSGGRFRHHYQLAGAPSAIDAAMIAAAR